MKAITMAGQPRFEGRHVYYKVIYMLATAAATEYRHCRIAIALITLIVSHTFTESHALRAPLYYAAYDTPPRWPLRLRDKIDVSPREPRPRVTGDCRFRDWPPHATPILSHWPSRPRHITAPPRHYSHTLPRHDGEHATPSSRHAELMYCHCRQPRHTATLFLDAGATLDVALVFIGYGDMATGH